LSAGALLAAGFVSSQAQPVYSQNIVGYASVVTPQAGQYYMMSVPFTIGVSNGANEVFGTSLPDFSLIYVWNAGSQTFTVAEYDSTQPQAGHSWYLPDDYTPIQIPKLPVGQGFYLNPGGANVTNTFAGTVAVAVGGTNSITIPTAGAYYMIGSAIPYAGSVTNGNPTGAAAPGINLNGLPDFSLVYAWNASSQTFTVAEYDSTQPQPGYTWYLPDDYTPTTPPSLTVGQGFYINLGSGTYTWNQTLSGN
jgi:hypothetical protein